MPVAEMIVLLPVARGLVLLLLPTPPLYCLWVSGLYADDDDGVELGSATQKLKDSRKITRKYVIFKYLLILSCGFSFSWKLSFFFFGTHLFLVCDYVSVWLQGNLRKINVERVKTFEFYII